MITWIRSKLTAARMALFPTKEETSRKILEKLSGWEREEEKSRIMTSILCRHRDAMMQKRHALLASREPLMSEAWVYSMGPSDFEAMSKLGFTHLLGFKLQP